jgi:hypothetical protein
MKAIFLSLLLLMSSSVFALDFGDVCHAMATKEASKTEWSKFQQKFESQWQTAQIDNPSEGIRAFTARKLLEKIPGMKGLDKNKPEKITEIFCWIAMFKYQEEEIPWYLKTMVPDDFNEELLEKVKEPNFKWKDLNEFLIEKMERHSQEAEEVLEKAD